MCENNYSEFLKKREEELNPKKKPLFCYLSKEKFEKRESCRACKYFNSCGITGNIAIGCSFNGDPIDKTKKVPYGREYCCQCNKESITPIAITVKRSNRGVKYSLISQCNTCLKRFSKQYFPKK